jgi:pseudoazurin
MINYRTILATATALVTICATPVFAANFDVQLLNKGDSGLEVFEPALTHIAVGDTVTFKATDKGHDVATIDGMIPAGAQPTKGDTSKDLVVTFTTPGGYGFKCTPHYAMGMVALVVVGDVHPTNLDALKAVHMPNKDVQRFDAIYDDLAKLK